MNKKIFGILLAFSLTFIGAAVFAVLFFAVEAKLELNGESYVTCNVFDKYSDEGVSASYLWFDLSDKVECVSDVNTDKLGEYKVTYTLKYHRKEYEQIRTVQVADKTPPQITLLGEDGISVSSMDFYTEPGYTAADNYDGDITDKVSVTRNTDGDGGNCIITYTVRDFSGNIAKAERKVIVSDKTAPVITLSGSEEMNINTPVFNDPGCTAIDDLDGNISGRIVVESDYESGVEGTFKFKYSVSDAAGNTAEVERTIHVKDTVAPVISLLGDKTLYVGIGESYTDPGATASDAFDGDVSESITVVSQPATDTAGTYEMKYRAVDSKGNEAYATRKIVVFRRPKIIDVPYLSQNGSYPNGCESVSAVMALNYAGIQVTVDSFINNYLDMADAPKIGEMGPDPNVAYGGNPKSVKGWGCYSPVIVNAMNKFVDGGSYNISHAYGVSLEELCSRYIDNNIPVVVWTTINMMDSSASKYYVHWTTADGNDITYNRKLHCMLLVGYDDDKYYFNDPKSTGNGTNYIGYSKSASNNAYGLMNMQSIAVYRK